MPLDRVPEHHGHFAVDNLSIKTAEADLNPVKPFNAPSLKSDQLLGCLRKPLTTASNDTYGTAQTEAKREGRGNELDGGPIEINQQRETLTTLLPGQQATKLAKKNTGT